MTVKLRLIGDRDEIAAILELLSSVMDVASGDRKYSVRDGFPGDIRTYAEVRANGHDGQTLHSRQGT